MTFDEYCEGMRGVIAKELNVPVEVLSMEFPRSWSLAADVERIRIARNTDEGHCPQHNHAT
jgi:hypothetical protein